jgi:deoxyribodipyrimidine photo-lyase
LVAAAATKRPLIPLFITDESEPFVPGGASRWWLHGCLTSLAGDLAKAGATLILRRGPPSAVLADVIAASGASAVYWTRCYEPAAIARDSALKTTLRGQGLEVQSFNGSLLAEPWDLRTQSGTPFRVFTPVWKALARQPQRKPFAAPRKLVGDARPLASDALESWGLRPTAPDWAGGLREMWVPGEHGAKQNLAQFLRRAADYHRARDIPGTPGTSQLSPYLHFGEISPQQIWAAMALQEPGAGVAAFQRELAWREFTHHLLYHFPHLPDEPLRTEFAHFPWRKDAKALKAWQRGQTGYPIVDAGMRELWHTGWMHNRVRMIVASFLVKHLLLPWQAGARWFWDTLVDADLANNAASWQWVAGCGADAAPYFRIFNPVLQGHKFDADGRYVRRWVPELARLPDAHLQAPWEAPDAVLRDAGIVLDKTYPAPIVDHAAARARALAAFKSLRRDTED